MLLHRQNVAGPNYIAGLTPAAWFRYAQGITVTGSGVSQWDDQSGNARHLLQGTDASRPIGLVHAGENYVWNGGVAANTLTAPTTAITGNVTIAFDGTLLDYTPAADVTLVSKTSGLNGFEFKLLTTGVLRLTVGDGAALTNVDSNASVGSTDNTRVSLRVDWTDGVGASFSANGVAVGTAVAAVKTLTNAAVSATIGPYSGKLYRAVVTNGGATSYYDALPTGATDQAATFIGGAGETWTINSTGSKPAQIVARSSILFDGAAHFLKCGAFTLNQPCTIYLLGKAISWASPDRWYDGNAASTVTLFQSGSTPSSSIFAGATVGAVSLALGTYGIFSSVFNGASSLNQLNGAAPVTGNAGANNAAGFTLASTGVGNWGNIQVLEAIIFPAAHDATTRARVIQYLNFVGNLGI